MAVTPDPTAKESVPMLIDRARSLVSLQTAWDKVRLNGGCSGGDGVTIARFARDAARKLSVLSDQLGTGSYRPSPVREGRMPKRSGGFRPLAIPSIVDRIAQSAVSATLTPILEKEFSDASYAYRPGRSVEQAVRAVTAHRKAGFDWVAESDIEKCFDRISHDPLMEKLESVLAEHGMQDRELLDLIGTWLEDWATLFGTPGRGLAQGSPLSPLLANLALDDADDALDAKAGVRIVRFADDFVLLCRDKLRAEEALSTMREVLEEAGLALNEDKTRITSFEKGLSFLGHLFVHSLVMKEEMNAPDEVDAFLQTLALKDADDAADALDQEAAEARDRRAGLVAGSRTLFLSKPGRELTIDDGSLVVSEAVQQLTVEVLRLAPERVDRVEIADGVEISASTLADLADINIAVDLLDARGALRAAIQPPLADRAALHMAQARAIIDPVQSQMLRRAFVEGRIGNERALLRKLNRKRKLENTSTTASKLGRLIRHTRSDTSKRDPAGLEAEAASLYWPALQGHAPVWARGKRRTRQPPQSPFSAVVSYLSALATREMSHAVNRAGLHPGFGVLHVAQNYAEACVYDLIEEFRAPLTEGPAIYLFNVGTLKQENFNATDGPGTRIEPNKRGDIIRVFRRTLATEFKNPFSGRRTTWGGMMLYQARALSKAVQQGTPYRPFIVDH